MKRQRATIIVEIDGRILLVENRGGLLLLPGGGINAAESGLQAAARELAEETGLIAESMLFLFSHDSPTNCHHVFWAAAPGAPFAGDDASALHFFDPDNSALNDRMSKASRRIIDRFLGMRGWAATADELLPHLRDCDLRAASQASTAQQSIACLFVDHSHHDQTVPGDCPNAS